MSATPPAVNMTPKSALGLKNRDYSGTVSSTPKNGIAESKAGGKAGPKKDSKSINGRSKQSEPKTTAFSLPSHFRGMSQQPILKVPLPPKRAEESKETQI